MASAERVFRIIDTRTALPAAREPRRAHPLAGSIRFEHVWFSYDERALVLKDVDFEVRRGETLAIVGATGAGKSTIIDLLLRLRDPTRGRVLVDGIDVREFSAAEHRRRFGLVLQDVAIFSRDVLGNLDLDRGLDPAVLRRAAEQVHAHGLIERLPARYREVMKERGRTLSSGERQLLAFARALAGDPEILVLDEATSHIDAGSEALIQDALVRLTAGRTSVIVAHRLSTIRKAQRILVLHHGQLREQGTHEQLLASGGIYATLHQLQFGATPRDDGDPAGR